MTGDLDEQVAVDVWWEPLKWKGYFKISWAFIKDIGYETMSHIIE
jgi:hypothetical protein